MRESLVINSFRVEKGLDFFVYIFFFFGVFYIVSNYQWEQKKFFLGFKLASVVLSWVNIHSIRLMTGSSNSFALFWSNIVKILQRGQKDVLFLTFEFFNSSSVYWFITKLPKKKGNDRFVLP